MPPLAGDVGRCLERARELLAGRSADKPPVAEARQTPAPLEVREDLAGDSRLGLAVVASELSAGQVRALERPGLAIGVVSLARADAAVYLAVIDNETERGERSTGHRDASPGDDDLPITAAC